MNLRAPNRNELDAKLKGVRPKHARDVTKCLGARSLVPFTAEPPVWIGNPKEAPGPRKSCIAVSNGILNLNAAVAGNVDALRPHSPLWFSLTALPYAYDATAECPQWLAFLAVVFDSDRERIDLIQEWFGLCLTRETSHQAILLLEGPRRSGKGTTLRMLRTVVGDDNTVAPRLSALGELFGLQGLVGKTVAICPDAHVGRGVRALGILEVLKSISGEDAIEVHRKHLPPITVRLGVRFALAVNELPKFGDASNALASRLLILPYRKSFQGREDRHLEERLSVEVKGVLNWAITGLRRLRQNGRFTVPAISREILGDFEKLTSPVKAFAEDECCVELRALVEKDRLWTRWQEWCKRTGHDAESSVEFAVALRSLFPQIQAKRPRAGQGKRIHKWVGIGLLKHASGGGQGGQG